MQWRNEFSVVRSPAQIISQHKVFSIVKVPQSRTNAMIMDGHMQKQWQWQYLTLSSTWSWWHSVPGPPSWCCCLRCSCTSSPHSLASTPLPSCSTLNWSNTSMSHIMSLMPDCPDLLHSSPDRQWIYFPFLWCLLLEVSVYACEVRSKNCDGGASGGLCSLDIAKRVMNEDIEDVLENQDPGHSTRAFSRFWWVESLNYAILSTSRP